MITQAFDKAGEAATTAIVRPLDGLRRVFWRWSAKTQIGRDCLRDRSLRLFVLALGHIGVTLALTLVAPIWLLLLGPIVLGFPHVVSDIRYLLVAPVAPFRGLERKGLVLVLGPLALMTFFRVMPILGLPSVPYGSTFEVLLGAAAIAGGLAVSRLTPRQKIVGIVLVLALGALGASFGRTTSIIVAHVHNLVAFGLWLAIYRAEASLRRVLVLAAAYLAIMALTLGGAFDSFIFGHLDAHAAGLDYDYMVRSVATDVEPTMALRLVTFYAFAQALHYVVWLRLMPQRLDARTVPPTFSRSLRRLRDDFGRWGLVAIVAVSIATPLAMFVFDAIDVRLVYLLVVVAHGWLEFAVLASLGAERMGRRDSAA